MRAAAGDLPIVVLSGSEDAKVADRCLRAGANELRHILARAIERER